jgi:hypothetical protein
MTACDEKNNKPAVNHCGAGSSEATEKTACCSPRRSAGSGPIDENVPGFLGWLTTPAGKVPRICWKLTLADHLGACKARWAIKRMSYFVPAGLYAIGNPRPDDPVVVTANYKMSFDIVRNSLAGQNVWLLVLETYGINVWCAAGKGTFSTKELVQRIEATGLTQVVTHRRLILPILGAPGVAAHQVIRQSGFSVSYATIRAEDLPEYLDNGMKTTPAMQELTFSLRERLVLIPVEVVLVLKTLCIWGAVLFIAATLLSGIHAGVTALAALTGAVLTGVALTPILLPWIPVRSFSVKGALAGLAWSTVFYLFADGTHWSPATTIAAFLALPAISAFYAFNFTGCTNFTSRSGVKKEMRLGIPIMGCAFISGLLILVAGRFL